MGSLERLRDALPVGAFDWAGGRTAYARAGAGEGAFRFEQATVGFVLAPQPAHAGRYGSDKVRAMPLVAGAGWVLPAGVDGWCSWTSATDFLNLALGDDALAEAADGAKPALRIGAQVEEPALARLVLELHGAAAASADPVRALYRDTLTRAIAAQIVARYGGAPTARLGGGGHDPRIRRVLDHIEAHLAEPLTLEGLAAVAAMSPFHFAKVFKAQVGEPPHKYWAGKRVERAKALLRTTRLPIAEIAWRVGWENPSNFAQAFKAATGTTPGAWRAAA